ncbi:MAG: RNA-binding protein [Candidatus Micrarchaeota archaeon]|nr:RNA-binding protein [Candidatus Micrarchaeota archaeon]
MKLQNCSSCGQQTREYSILKDPNSDGFVIRCKHCRELSIPYTFPSSIKGP